MIELIKKNKKILVGVVIIGLISTVSMLNKPGIEVKVGTAQTGPIEEYVDETGTTFIAGKREVNSLIAGEVVEILVEHGDKVGTGTVLAKVDATDYHYEEQRLQSSLESAKAQLAQLKSGAKREEIKALEADYQEAVIMAEEAERQLQQGKELYDQQALSQDEYSQLKAVSEAAKARVARSEASLKLAKSGATANEIKQLEAQVDGIAASLNLLTTQKGRTQIISPIDGTVLARKIEVGSVVQMGSPTFEIGQLDRIKVRTEILAEEIGAVKVGQKAVVSGKVLDHKSIEGKVINVYPQAQITISTLGLEQQRVPVEIEVPMEPRLKANYEVDTKIITDHKQAKVKIPEGATFKQDGEYHCFVVENNLAQLRQIKVGLKNDKEVEVLEGIKAGEKVILYPSIDVKPGVKVTL